MEPRIVPGNRGGKILVAGGFRYQRDKTTETKIHWKCWRRGTCTARVTTNYFDVNSERPDIRLLVFDNEAHRHPADDDITRHTEIRERPKASTMNNPTSTTKRTFDAEVAQLARQGGGDREGLQYHSFRSAMQRARAAVIPPVPGTIEEVHINGPWAETREQERFLFHLDEHWGIAIFATDENLIKLRASSVLYMDATFRACPRPYEQLFNILGNVNGFVVPLVHVLMGHRTVGHYRRVLARLKVAVRNLTHHALRPRRVICDFERALLTSIETELPHSQLKACYFRFTQSLWRKVQELGLAADYRRSQRLARFIRKLLAIGYLPIALLALNFNRVVAQREARHLMRRFPDLQDFLHYMRRTYIGLRATLPPQLRCVTERNMDQRTNNHVESFHRKFATAIAVRRPNLRLFLRVLKDQQALTESAFEAARRGSQPPRRRRKWSQLEERLVELKRQYNEGERNLEDVLGGDQLPRLSIAAHC